MKSKIGFILERLLEAPWSRLESLGSLGPLLGNLVLQKNYKKAVRKAGFEICMFSLSELSWNAPGGHLG